MVARNGDACGARLCDGGQEPVDACHCVCARGGSVVDIACDEQSVYLTGADDVEDALEHEALVVEHGKFVDLFSDMQVGDVQKTHGAPLCSGV